MAPPTQAAIPLTVRVRPSLALSSTSEIELRYDGAHPPLDLLADLTRLGWEGATACPPPAHAIDWTCPDPDRGTRHTIRSFDAVTTASLNGTDPHRAAGVEQARLVLARHGVLPDAPDAPRDDPSLTSLSPNTSTIRFEVVVPPGLAADVRALAQGIGEVELDEPDLWTSSTTYRRSKTVEHHEARRLVLAVPANRRDELLMALSLVRPWALRPLRT